MDWILLLSLTLALSVFPLRQNIMALNVVGVFVETNFLTFFKFSQDKQKKKVGKVQMWGE
jgi:hypothetical protein